MKYIVGLTIKEIINKRILHLGLILTLIFLVVYGAGLHYCIKDYSRSGVQYLIVQQIGYQLMCLGWYMATFLSGALAIMMGAGSVSREIETGTILSLASRPLSRSAILMGKYIAYTLITALYSILLTISITYLAIYYFKLPIHPVNLLISVALFILLPLLLLSVTHLSSVSLSTMATGVIGFMLFAVAVIGGFIEQIGALIDNTGLLNVGVVSSLILPADSIYRLAVSHAGGTIGYQMIANFGPFGTTSTPSNWMLLYTLLYIALTLGLAIRKFSRRDL
ncbi:MAG: ABC transporter permease subunit [Syntrophomonas sp.]